jgi:uncharacterized repeat protein (TIGR01451 family)
VVDVTVAKANFDFYDSDTRTTTLHVADQSPLDISYLEALANGVANALTSTAITLKFDDEIIGLAVADITLDVGGAVGVSVNATTLTGPVIGTDLHYYYELGISGAWPEGQTVDVTVIKDGYNINPDTQTATLHTLDTGLIKESDATGAVHTGQVITYTIDLDNTQGAASKTFAITDTLDAALVAYVAGSTEVDGLAATEPVITGAENNELAWSVTVAAGQTSTLSFKVEVTGQTGTISNTAVIDGTQTNTVDDEIAGEINYLAATANGVTNTVTSTMIKISFDKEVIALSEADISLLVGGASGASVIKGTLSAAYIDSSGSYAYDLAVSGTWPEGQSVSVKVTKANYTFMPDTRAATLHTEANPDFSDLSLLGYSGIYDGNNHTATLSGLRITDVVSWEYSLGGNPRQASAFNPAFRDVNEVYTGGGPNNTIKVYVTVTREGKTRQFEANIRITPRPITVKPVDKKKTYDGTALLADSMELVSGTLVGGHGFDTSAVVYQGTQTAVGLSQSLMSGVRIAGSDQRNYAITHARGLLEVLDNDDNNNPPPDPGIDPGTPGEEEEEEKPQSRPGNNPSGGGNGNNDPVDDPLGPTDPEGSSIEEIESPTGSFWSFTGWSLLSLILSLIAVLSAVYHILSALVLRLRQRKEEALPNEDESQDVTGLTHKGAVLRTAVIALGLLTAAIWLLFEDLTTHMVLVNRFTIIVGICFILHILVTIIHSVHRRNRQAEE